MRYPSESRYGLFERLVSLCNDVGLLAKEYEADAVRRLYAPRPTDYRRSLAPAMAP
jgi:hypothetical protein